MRHKQLIGMKLSEYAAHRKRLGLVGSTRQSVHAAVKAKRVSLLPDGSIDAAVADMEWQQRTDPSKQRAVSRHGRAPAVAVGGKPKADAGTVASGDGEYHAGRVQAIADIASVKEVLSFAVICVHFGCSREIACAIAQQHSSRAALALEDVTCDDLIDESFADPTAEQWRAALGEFDQDEADALCDSVAARC